MQDGRWVLFVWHTPGAQLLAPADGMTSQRLLGNLEAGYWDDLFVSMTVIIHFTVTGYFS